MGLQTLTLLPHFCAMLSIDQLLTTSSSFIDLTIEDMV